MAFLILLALSIVPIVVCSIVVFQLGFHKGYRAVKIWLSLCLLPWIATAIVSHATLRNPDSPDFEFALLATIASSFPLMGCLPGLFWLDCVQPCKSKPKKYLAVGFTPTLSEPQQRTLTAL